MTNLLQRQASSPEQSVFVSANAGTGKTKVLIERVLRLLLSGTKPETILCVTFTNAAAAEIAERLQSKLAQWAVIPESDLLGQIKDMTGTVPEQETIMVARRLFAQVIDNDEGPRIETTHSFCQSLLSRFPIEAGLPPQFDLITDGQKEQFLHEAFASCFEEPGKEIKQALAHLISLTDHRKLFEHVRDFVSFRKLSDAAIEKPLGFVSSFERAMADILPNEASDRAGLRHVYARRFSEVPHQTLTELAPKKMENFVIWSAQTEDMRAQTIGDLKTVFLTTKNEPRKFLTDKQAESYPAEADIAARLCALMISYQQALTAFDTYDRSCALYIVGRHVAQQYERIKLQKALLDYDDLIIRADRLLSAADAMAWVRWKLDYGIQHMLVDEAQDTNPAQWELLASLANEFFAHEADETSRRTLFSVGDFKQSIYSFQGANPQIFLDKGKSFLAQAKAGGHPFEEVALTQSFRSSTAVLDMVNAVMTLEDVKGLGGDYQNHEAFFTEKFGMVELWPIEEAPENTNDLPYFDVPDFVDDSALGAQGAEAQLAEKIACHIKTLLDGSATGLDGRCYKPGDIMILVNKRNMIYALIRGALLRHNVPVAGADRMHLSSQIEVADLMALGDICLLPEDDLQLAAFLKSPLIGIDEDELMYLASRRAKGQSLIAALKAHAGADTKLGHAIGKIETYFDLAIRLSPSAFFQTILAKGGREAFYRRLGTGVDESLNAFIAQAYEFEAKGGISLSDFLAYMRQHDTEIKRDFGKSQENLVRIMTIHGSKGLEAPVVYIPDIVKGIEPPKTLIKTDEALYWPANSQFMPEYIAKAKQQAKDARSDEHQRLLYVAMTRASECLFLAGFEKSRKDLQGISWDILLKEGFKSVKITEDEEGVYRYRHEGADISPKALTQNRPTEQIDDDIQERLSWAFSPPPQEQAPVRPLVPSMAGTHNPQQIKGSMTALAARQSGSFQHHLLDMLSDKQADRRADIAQRFARNSKPLYPEISDGRREELADNMVAFMAMPEFSDLFSERALSEFGISGLVGTRSVVGQIDKMVIYDDVLWLVDFKSGAHLSDEVPENYVLQLALYAHLLGKIYPEKRIKAEIIWLDEFSRSPVSSQAMDTALTKAKILPSASL
ncbi:MAG: double-strand break repair helicase AddA [Candidatus Puniceispirillaceae bacterium]